LFVLYAYLWFESLSSWCDYVHFDSFAMQLTSSSWYFQSQLRALQLRPQDRWSHNIRVGIMAILQNRVGMSREFVELYSLYYFTFYSRFLFVAILSS
jgi:hypothetical protein